VVAYVKSEGRPAEIRDDEIDRLRQLVELGYHLEARSGTDHFSKGDRVRIAAGPLKGMEGLVSDRGDETEICMILDSIHHSIIVRLPKGMLAAF
jgi:transcription antitermination factor NusG